MKIQILGTGCSKCNLLYERIKKLADEMQSNAEILKVEDIMEIMKFGVMATPAVVVDGKIVAQGSIPKESEIKNWLLDNGKIDLKALVKQRYNDLALASDDKQKCCCNPLTPAVPSKKFIP